MINPTDLQNYIIIPTLVKLNRNGGSAVNLLLGTAAQESSLGYHLAQMHGPAKGLFEMEPATHDDIWKNYLSYNHDLTQSVLDLVCKNWHDKAKFMTNRGKIIEYPSACEMIGNLYYATAMARIHYLRVPEPLPHADDIQGLAHYWKTYYNTKLGKGTEEEFVRNYKRFKLDK